MPPASSKQSLDEEFGRREGEDQHRSGAIIPPNVCHLPADSRGREFSLPLAALQITVKTRH